MRTWLKRCTGVIVLVSPSVETAKAAASETLGPRVYIVEPGFEVLAEIFQELAKEDLAGGVTMFHGTLARFVREIAIAPELLIVEGGPVEVRTLVDWLPAGAAVVAAESEVAEAVAGGVLVREGDFFRATRACRGRAVEVSESARWMVQGELHSRYFGAAESAETAGAPAGGEAFTTWHPGTGQEAGPTLRREIAAGSRGACGRGAWPYAAPQDGTLPATLPGGKPWPKISIVTPTFNQGAYIEETLLSVIHQGYPNVEHIVMDGGSTDGTLAVLERYRDRLTHYRSEPDNGQSHAINKGMALASGEILTWLNSDDMLAPGALAAMALAFETNDCDMVAGICQLYREGTLVAQHITSCEDGPLPLHDLLELDHCWNAGQFFYQPEVMFTRELWQRAGGYVNDWLHYSMDYEMWLRFAEAGARLHVIGRPVAWFRLHEQQKTHVTTRFQAELLVCREDFLRQRDMEHAAAEAGRSRSQLRITLLNDIGPFYGAGIAHARMARALAWAGHEISLVSILDRSILGIESRHYTTAGILERVVETRPDLVIVGNLHAAGVDAFLLQELCERFPTSVVMHDFWTITGRCAYPKDCEKYLTGCDHTCPTADEYPAMPPERIADEWRKKRLVLGGAHGPALLMNSEWAAGIVSRAMKAPLDGAKKVPAVVPFHLSFPLDVFKPRDPLVCREMLGLPADKFIVLVAGSINDPRKGGMAFLEAMARLDLPDLLVVTLGPPDPGLRLPVPVRQLGQIFGQQKVALVNSAADLVVAPSSEETFGQTAVEAIACGTPALAHAVTGIREAIRDGVTGLLAEPGADNLAAAVQFLYARPELRREMARWGRLYVENEWSEFSASLRLYRALRAVDTDGRIGLGRNLRFLAESPVLPEFQTVAKCEEGWRPCQGFSAMEYAVPEHDLGPSRWAYGPSAIAELFARQAGLHRVLIAYRNPHEGQRIEFRCNGAECGVYDLATTGFSKGRLLVVNVPLEQGVNLLQMSFRVWELNSLDERPLAMIVTDIVVEPVAICDHLARQTSASQMLSEVWGK